MDFNRHKGKEIRKIRPAVVISNDIQNKYDCCLTVAPTSSDELEIIRPFEVGLDTDSKILLNQIHSIDHQARLRGYLGQLEGDLIKDTENKISSRFGLKNSFVLKTEISSCFFQKKTSKKLKRLRV